jgi:hypothetical protein
VIFNRHLDRENDMNRLILSLCLAMVTLAGTSGSAYATVAGHMQFVYGAVHLADGAGRSVTVRKGDAVNEGDTLATDEGASAQIRMEDGGFIAVRPGTQLKIDSFKFKTPDNKDQSFFSLFKGGFRAITGLIGKINKADYRISTPYATLGIRGTDHEIVVVVPGSAMAALTPVGTYNKVNMGETTLTTSKGMVAIMPNQMGFSGGFDQKPRLQPLNLNLFNAVPAPVVQGGDGGNDEGIRDHAVVDIALPGQGGVTPLGTGMMQGVAVGSVANSNFVLRPITAVVTTTTGGLGATTGLPVGNATLPLTLSLGL